MHDTLALVALAVGAAVLVVLAAWVGTRVTRKPRDRERQRRLTVNEHGRLADGSITEATEAAIFYSYSVGGVDYATSQDIADLREIVRVPPERLIGSVVTVKYETNNPGNSIIVCEAWSGLRVT